MITMNWKTRDAINTALASLSRGLKREYERNFYYMTALSKLVSNEVFASNKVADQYSNDMSTKENVYTLEDALTGEDFDNLLVINEYFSSDGMYEINAYVS